MNKTTLHTSILNNSQITFARSGGKGGQNVNKVNTKVCLKLALSAIDGINPVEFFTEGDVTDDGKFYPDRRDIVQLSGKTILVLTKEKHNRAIQSLTGMCLENGLPDITSLSSIK